MTMIHLALGGNLGDRLANLEAAIDALAPEITVLERSPIYETDPKYVTDQPRFLNMALSAETNLDASSLLLFLKSIEKKLGR
ncbi:MAG: 2-amino-4-hydroxy-6-hydroxymethyldihydropteridine diphosphokinase, partial [Alphaproteobacteria bacterium]|nr:2-amino-4-hydroxy-6-hydroxymethyldihydropteridine diphosphokinase [Alphaproteobacteria bacterium]